MIEKEILQHSGEISHQKAIKKANKEYDKYKDTMKDKISGVEMDFLKAN